MKLQLNARSLRGLRAQVLLWMILPLTILLIVLSLTGISSHQNSMHALAAEENAKLVSALAKAISTQVENYRLRSQASTQNIPVSVLELNDLLDLEHSNTPTTLALINTQGKVIYGKGELSAGTNIRDWPGVTLALDGNNGTLFTSAEDDLIAYTPVPNTDWALIIREPWDALTVPLIHFEQAMPFILGSAILMSFLTLFFGLRFVVRPLHELGQRATRIGQGDFQAAAQPVGGVNEIEDLRISVNQMAGRIENYQTALQDYLRAITQTQEDERARLGRELHDETIQTLIALGHKAQMAQRTLERDPAQTKARVDELRQMIDEAVQEVRRFSQALRPVYLEELGLIPALEMLAREAGAAFQIVGSPCRLRADKELALYRIAQESLNNAHRHAEAQNLSLDFQFTGTDVTLRVCDDGIGSEIPPSLNELTRTGHFGLIGIRERAQLIGGQISITSSPSKGTIVTVTLPA
ncbi:MAG: histidine kinase [Anaerolineae bacterium]